MRLIQTRLNGIDILRLDERKLDTANSGLLKGEFQSLISEYNIKKLIIDLSAVEQCDSSGLSAILVANRAVQDNGGQVRLIASEKISQLFTITKLDSILTLHATVEEAANELEGAGN